ncbi:protein C-ets-1-like [Limulus polyphemus]|uniref:Protein C-ets-1-like n=1 Tax=Limulus polyphemus TaxID=6850 RepID=A0ABM1THH8_LIMPO|nr:protein C-ets-1-like [Limulus polyphemus]
MYPSALIPESPACPCHGVSVLTVLPLTDSRGNKFNDSWSDEKSNFRLSRESSPAVTKGTSQPPLPRDPRQWTRDHVASWLKHMSSCHRLPSVKLERFLMNGKALCLMNMEMFVQRVPLGGKLLYKDFQLRLTSVLYS